MMSFVEVSLIISKLPHPDVPCAIVNTGVKAYLYKQNLQQNNIIKTTVRPLLS